MSLLHIQTQNGSYIWKELTLIYNIYDAYDCIYPTVGDYLQRHFTQLYTTVHEYMHEYEHANCILQKQFNIVLLFTYVQIYTKTYNHMQCKVVCMCVYVYRVHTHTVRIISVFGLQPQQHPKLTMMTGNTHVVQRGHLHTHYMSYIHMHTNIFSLVTLIII